MNKLFVANLPYTVSDQELGDYFAQAGKVTSTQVILSRDTGRSKGFGFVEMETEEGFKAALALNGIHMNGRPLVVNEAKPERSGAAKPANDFIQQIKNFCLSNPQPGDELGFVVDNRYYTLARD